MQLWPSLTFYPYPLLGNFQMKLSIQLNNLDLFCFILKNSMKKKDLHISQLFCRFSFQRLFTTTKKCYVVFEKECVLKSLLSRKFIKDKQQFSSKNPKCKKPTISEDLHNSEFSAIILHIFGVFLSLARQFSHFSFSNVFWQNYWSF